MFKSISGTEPVAYLSIAFSNHKGELMERLKTGENKVAAV